MGQKQKLREEKKASAASGVDCATLEKTSKAAYDRKNVAEVIARMKALAKEDTDRFAKMGLHETIERLEQSQKVAATIDAALAVEMTRKRALLGCFLSNEMTPPAPAAAAPTPTLHGAGVGDAVAKKTTAGGDGDDGEEEDEVANAKRQLAESQAEARRKLSVAKSTRAHNDEMVDALRAKGVTVPSEGVAAGG